MRGALGLASTVALALRSRLPKTLVESNSRIVRMCGFLKMVVTVVGVAAPRLPVVGVAAPRQPRRPPHPRVGAQVSLAALHHNAALSGVTAARVLIIATQCLRGAADVRVAAPRRHQSQNQKQSRRRQSQSQNQSLRRQHRRRQQHREQHRGGVAPQPRVVVEFANISAQRRTDRCQVGVRKAHEIVGGAEGSGAAP